ncbi:MAG: hypothetical protein HW419_3911 [Deltaproteobacteria bacterium]|nr:hypothetical protein [Deltaproteobacteria bacterium]
MLAPFLPSPACGRGKGEGVTRRYVLISFLWNSDFSYAADKLRIGYSGATIRYWGQA